MSVTKLAGLGTCFMLLGTSALHADVSAGEVWQAWLGQYRAAGYTVTSKSENQSGDTLTISELALTQSADGATFKLMVPELTLREMGDGTVEARASQEMTAEADVTAPDEPPTEMDIKIRQADAVAIISGTPENLAYQLTAPEIVVEAEQVAGEGSAQPVKISLSATGLSGAYSVVQEAGQKITSDMKLSGVKLIASGDDPQNGGSFALDADIADVKMTAAAELPPGYKFDPNTAVPPAVDSVVTTGAAHLSLDAKDAEGPVTLKSASESTRIEAKVTEGEMHYLTAAQNSRIEMATPQLPAEVSAEIAATSFEIGMPLAKADVASPFVGKVALEGLTVSEGVWAMIDPGQQLPRDPATLIVDLSGKMRPTMDLFSAAAEAQPMPPVEIEALDINRVQLTLAGAELGGKGALSFDNATGVPVPLGAIDLSLTGANGLMDKLTTMGLLPQDQAMFAKMMLGLYAVPTGADAMSSKIEFKEGGQILANGQRIQ